MIYFIRASDGKGPIKIGSSHSPLSRVRSLQTSIAESLQIMGVCKGSQRYEQALHARFHAHRLTGEWFSPAQEILDFISSNCTPLEKAPANWSVKRCARGISDRQAEAELAKALTSTPLKAREIAELCGVSVRAVEGWRQRETLPTFAKTVALAREIPEVREMLMRLIGVPKNDPSRVLDEIQKLIQGVAK